MKRILAIALAAIFVLGMAATAMAAHIDMAGEGSGIKISGEFRARGANFSNLGDLDSNQNDHVAFIDQRFRMYLDILVADGVTVRTRETAGNGTWNGTKNTSNWTLDHAYLQAAALGGTWYIGRQPASWGNGFMVWDAVAERIKYVAKINDQVTVGGFLQQDRESQSFDDPNTAADETSFGSDKDSLSVFVIAKPVEDHKVSLIYVKTTDHQIDKEGTTMDVAYNGKIGPVGLMAEYVSKGGDLNETAGYLSGNGEGPTGMFVGGGMDVTDMINVSLAYASAANGFVADDNFTATNLFGKTQVSAISNFGDTTETGECVALTDATAKAACVAAARGDDKINAIVLGGKFKISDDLTLGATFAQATLSDLNEVDITEIDLNASYKIAANTTLNGGYTQGKFSFKTDPPTNDPITVAFWQLKTTF